MINYIKEMRIKHYIKNLVIALPLFFSGKFNFSNSLLINVIVAIASFSLMSSAVYVINDIKDIEKDRQHDTKKLRPIASGKISVRNAIIFSILLIILSLLCSVYLFIITSNIANIICVAIYLIVNILYSVMHLKNIPLLDVSIIVIGFFLRLYMGSTCTGIANSIWIYLVVISGSFFLGFGKRKAEIERYKDSDTRESLKTYDSNFLTHAIYSCITLVIVFFALWCKEKIDTTNIGLYLALIPLMMIVCFKYTMDLNSSKYDGDPVNTILKDKVMLVLIGLIGLCFIACLYMV